MVCGEIELEDSREQDGADMDVKSVILETLVTTFDFAGTGLTDGAEIMCLVLNFTILEVLFFSCIRGA